MSELVRQAAQILRDGGLVAFATETVYGLGADARNSAAVRKIYAVKGRPAINPLIVHVTDRAAAKSCAAEWPPAAEILARALWPGPLTLVVPRHPSLASEVGAGLNTVGLRAPSHPLAQQLLREFAGPIAAPSANRSNRISPTTAQHVRDDLGDAVNLILDGGSCQIGIESTVVDVTGPRPTILRPGSISRQRIAELIGEVDLPANFASPGARMSSPGQQALHYAPTTPAFRFAADQAHQVAAWCNKNPERSAAILLRENSASLKIIPAAGPHRVILMPADAKMYAARLYSALRDCDRGDFAAIWVEEPPESAEWTAVRDRISRAARLLLDLEHLSGSGRFPV
jgi:L-threonylcarbamoyladenylate synthase